MTDQMTAAEYRAGWDPPEAELRQAIIDEARRLGWKVYFTWNSQHSPAGFPDLILAKPGRPLIAWELKTRRGRVAPAQREWLTLLLTTRGVIAEVVRPDDWDRVLQVLAGGAQ